jgi:hypothetical protein
MKRWLLYLIMTGLASGGCYITKKRYRQGFYAESANKRVHHAAIQNVNLNANRVAVQCYNAIERPVLPASSVTGGTLSLQGSASEEKNPWEPPDLCDTIVLKNGKKISARVSEIAAGKIRYTRCSPGHLKTLFVRTSKVKRIVLRDNTIANIPQKANVRKIPEPGSAGGPRTEPLGVLALFTELFAAFCFYFSFFGAAPAQEQMYFFTGLVLLLAGAVIGAISLYRIIYFPKKWKGMAFTVFSFLVLPLMVIISLLLLVGL